MPDHVSRFSAALYDQNEDDRTADWGGDELFTRMPRPRAVDTAPAPRFRPSLALVDPPQERRTELRGDERDARATGEPGGPHQAATAIQERAERRGLSLVEGSRPAFDRAAGERSPEGPGAWTPAEAATVRQWDGSVAEGRPLRVITGHPDGPPRPVSSPGGRRRPARTPAERIGARPERIVAWAFALGLLLILIAISTADAATV
jgi:hypothetical protein